MKIMRSPWWSFVFLFFIFLFFQDQKKKIHSNIYKEVCMKLPAGISHLQPY